MVKKSARRIRRTHTPAFKARVTLVDMVLRRRFAFVGLEPSLSLAWRDWVVKECAVDPVLVTDIERRIAELNE
jgi:5-methylcytosine-specific restriction protein B